MALQEVILVDELDNEIGREEKLKAHLDGVLHRAFSVFILNDKGELLLQQRASGKYHSPGLWTNTCCSHPSPGEELQASAQKRLQEEMGFTCPLIWLFKFKYKIAFDNNLTEHELDHVFVGRYNQDPTPNPEEVESWAWVNLDSLKTDLEENPEKYTYWFRYVYDTFYNTYCLQEN
ncbi:isopentenyl-diphosphate Delta-isomerase [Pontibacter arcticus]|uniref:Isopentenyl-diphosphate delta-isomerase n=1 Tax=Pontibacter arcticus TaxID=2080288 RepID=A0A364RJL6_9BACT|nr:isopentenyl-diphosphate Delta-isomerase [Pontibacter arcticus]RAU84481.1 isopentenyl-diphosphate delta-isomerase [Pontibacter arcticus]